MVVLGINAYHADSAACIVRDGELVAAAEEERFRRVKHWAGFPSAAIQYCLQEAKLDVDAVTHVAVNQDTRANLWRKLRYALTERPEIALVLDRIRNKRKRANVGEEISRLGSGFIGKICEVEHHLAHLGSAFLVSPFDEAIAVSVDGFGDFASAAWGVGRGNAIDVEGRVHFPHSLGIFYQAITQYLGFPNYGDEYKVMGLAPYGEPRFMREMRQIVRLEQGGAFTINLEMFRHHRENVSYDCWDGGEPTFGTLFSPLLEQLLGPRRGKDEQLSQRHKDIARSTQTMYEEAFFYLLNSLHKRTQIDSLALAGGCAMNSVANGRIFERSPFMHVYVQSAAGDAGGAIGAAFYVCSQIYGSTAHTKSKRGRFVMHHAYWGPGFSSAEIKRLLDEKRSELNGFEWETYGADQESDLCRQTALAIAEGKVVGWFQGRMEWGPRALGNRSILGDPRRPDMKDILNLKIKRRESFRPFAPSVLREAVPAWFDTDHDVPFMMQVYQFRSERKKLVPAVTHVDGSGRLQTVTKESNPRYYNLIQEFEQLTGIPMILNTSFNENEPVVCRPEEALDCFLRTKMDVLVLGDHVIRRSG
jgi:carbamoyltransferase